MDPHALSEALLRLATNYRWTWRKSCRLLLQSLPGADPEVHPLNTVKGLSAMQLDQLAADEEFISAVGEEITSLGDLIIDHEPTIAYGSPEFGLSAAVPQYAGGLGVLAGDFLKAASDSNLPIVGFGLFYHEGAFRQSIEEGHQVEAFDALEPSVVGAIETGVMVEIPFPGRVVKARLLRMDVGRVPLILLNTDVEGNSHEDRTITDRLYMGSESHRVEQEMVLGVGGVKALAALGWQIDTYHLNEGHAGFIALELIDQAINDGALGRAVERVRERVVFTTHTPVPAGIDKLGFENLNPYLDLWAGRWGVDPSQIWDLGSDPTDGHKFNMAVFCLRMSRAANGVSKLHGRVSRDLFSDLDEGRRIGHVTNGVHARTWTGDSAQDVFDEILGVGWAEGDEDAWARAEEIPDEAIMALRRDGSFKLADLVASSAGVILDPDALTIGFARRFAPYKRANLILADRDRLLEALADDGRPLHFLFAGKAHPSNDLAKSFLTEVVGFSESSESNARFTFIPDYDMRVGAYLVQGCDIWLNNPIHPREASGTSGEKVVLNGGLNCSIMDGWWAEMYDGENGWAIPSSQESDPVLRDASDSVAVMDAVLAAREEFFENRGRFNDRIRHAWRTLGPQVTSARMIGEYDSLFYRT